MEWIAAGVLSCSPTTRIAQVRFRRSQLSEVAQSLLLRASRERISVLVRLGFVFDPLIHLEAMHGMHRLSMISGCPMRLPQIRSLGGSSITSPYGAEAIAQHRSSQFLDESFRAIQPAPRTAGVQQVPRKCRCSFYSVAVARALTAMPVQTIKSNWAFMIDASEIHPARASKPWFFEY